MKRLLCCLFLISMSAGAQNWDPINSANTYNFFSDTSFASGCIIKTDSVSTIGSDSALYLNRIVTTMPGSGGQKRLCDQPQFFGRTCVKGNGFITFKREPAFTINFGAAQGTSWICDSLNNYTATVWLADTATVLGQFDSIKTITSSNSDTLILSKDHGIIFCHLANDRSYTLKGIENLNLGRHVPDYMDMFNFSLGDTFEYRKVHFHGTPSYYSTHQDLYHYKLTVLSRTSSGNTVTYSMQNISSDTLWTAYNLPYQVSQQTSTISVSYVDSAGDCLNSYNHAKKLVPHNSSRIVKPLEFGFNTVFQTYIKLYPDSSFYEFSSDTLTFREFTSLIRQWQQERRPVSGLDGSIRTMMILIQALTLPTHTPPT